ncbi:MAG: HTH-type transcriptional regulator BetI [Syntrophorhabdaceae bacterium PtaU1.Bin034]|nr:MAG: HTH-type transcriptional regulator BetI [Syntrophorhabdaceae bacterium PtaU1.Bin034]
MGRHSDSAREKIIDAAEEVVIERGARHLTFDAVAAKSGISRGGLLYHFRDKEALLKGMLDRLIERSKERRRKKSAELPEGIEREAVAHVLSFMEEDDEKAKKACETALFASAAHDPSLLEPAKREYRVLIDDLTRDGLRFERAAVVALATNGLRLLELLLISPFDKEERSRIIEEMISLAKDDKDTKEK